MGRWGASPEGYVFRLFMRSQGRHSVSQLHNTREIVIRMYKAACASEQVDGREAAQKSRFRKEP